MNRDRCICGEVLYTEPTEHLDYQVLSFRGELLQKCPGCGREVKEGIEEKLYYEIEEYEPLVNCGTCQPPRKSKA